MKRDDQFTERSRVVQDPRPAVRHASSGGMSTHRASSARGHRRDGDGAARNLTAAETAEVLRAAAIRLARQVPQPSHALHTAAPHAFAPELDGLHLLDAFELAPPGSAPEPRVQVIVIERVGDIMEQKNWLIESFGLTAREAEVAFALVDRLSSAEIAAELGISVHTVRRHSERVLEKLGVRSRREIGDVLRRRRECGGPPVRNRAGRPMRVRAR